MGAGYTDAQKKATYKYQEGKVKIQILVSENDRERYRKAAEKAGKSLTAFIIDCIEKEQE